MNQFLQSFRIRKNFSFEKINIEYVILGVAILFLIPALFINLEKLDLYSSPLSTVQQAAWSETGNQGSHSHISENGSSSSVAAGHGFKIYETLHGFLSLIPSLVLAIGFSLLIFLYLKPVLGEMKSILVSVMFITSGRVLFWETLNYDTDFGFALLMFMTMILVYLSYRSQKYSQMFILSWIGTAFACILKGYPAFVLQINTLFIFLILERRWKLLVSYKHLIGLAAFAGILFLYAGLISDSFSVPLFAEKLQDLLLKQTTPGSQKINFFAHLFQFPGELILFFLPWTFLFISWVRKDFFSIIQNNSFLKFSLIAFLTNISAYWLFPGLNARYTLALFPFLLILLLHFFNLDREQNNFRFKIIYIMMITASVIITIGFVAAPFLNTLASSNYGDIKIYLLFQTALLILLFIIKFRKYALLLFLVMVCLVRIAFDWFILPVELEKYSDIKNNATETERNISNNDFKSGKKINHAFTLSLYQSEDETN